MTYELKLHDKVLTDVKLQRGGRLDVPKGTRGYVVGFDPNSISRRPIVSFTNGVTLICDSEDLTRSNFVSIEDKYGEDSKNG